MIGVKQLSTALAFLAIAFVNPVSADQNHPDLAGLFEALQQAPSNGAAKEIENEIWLRWLDAPDQHSKDLLLQVTTALSVGQHELALQLSNQLVDLEPEFAEGWNKRATIQYLLGNFGYSVADIKETLLLEPRHFGALSGLGLIFTATGNYEAALDAFGQVLELSPQSNNAKGSIAQVKALMGDEV